MNDVGAAIVMRLDGAPGWSDAIGERLDWGVSLPETAFPRAVGTIVSSDNPDHYDGTDMAGTRFQLDVYSAVSSDEASRIARLSVPALQPEDVVGGVRFERAIEVSGPIDSGEQTDTIYVYRARIEFELMHADAEGDEPPRPTPGDRLEWSAIEW